MQRGAGVIELPTAKDLGFIWDRNCDCARRGGTSKAGGFSNRAINEYKETRNFPSVNGTSQLSAALNLG